MKYILGLVVFCFAQFSYSGCAESGCTGTPNQLFSTYYLSGYTDGRVLLRLSADKNGLD